jgi:branched-chain amino acid transport system ATP-binding protein
MSTAVMTGELAVSNLSAGYGRIAVVYDAEFAVRAGELVALLGRNGAGKTTALLAVAGLTYGPGSRTVLIDGLDVSRHRAHAVVAAGVNLVPEGRRIFRNMTVEENLRLGAFSRRRAGARSIGADLQRVHELFPALATARAKRAGELSGGQQQMVAIGQALMSKPRYLLLDEPMAGLAPILVDEIYAQLHLLAAEGLGVLIVDQSVERAVAHADRYYVLDSGRTVLGGECKAAALTTIEEIVLGTSALGTRQGGRPGSS